MKVLPCGHSCPSVCGEPCDSQRCVTCLPEEKKLDIVDFIMQRRLEDIDLASTDVSDRLITLDCGHIFTVETLDGHCGMNDYYDVDQMGCFISTKAPPISYQLPPTCPLCKGPITALRYGQVTKRATLDILEQNVASTMSRALDDLSPLVERIASDISVSGDRAKEIVAVFEGLSESSSPAATPQDEPLPFTVINMDAMERIHGIAPDEAKEWCNIVSDLLDVYRKVVKVGSTRGAHVQAYEAALSTLFRLELEDIRTNPERATDTPEPVAMDAVNHKIGQPPHKADTRFQIEAFFLSLELRFVLAQIGFSRLEGLPLTSNDEAVSGHRALWEDFIEFVHESCTSDAAKALSLARKSSASRQAARAAMYLLRSDFELTRFAVIRDRNELFRGGRLVDSERQKLGDLVMKKKEALTQDVFTTQQNYLRSRPSRNINDLQAERLWFRQNCQQKLHKWLEECDNLVKYIREDKVYQPLSLQEREDIVKAFGFSHRGHFYNCENGHAFVITECGGAMEAARCPECNAPIGGSDNRLIQSNTRATEFEEIAGRQGVAPGRWAWQQGA